MSTTDAPGATPNQVRVRQLPKPHVYFFVVSEDARENWDRTIGKRVDSSLLRRILEPSEMELIRQRSGKTEVYVWGVPRSAYGRIRHMTTGDVAFGIRARVVCFGAEVILVLGAPRPLVSRAFWSSASYPHIFFMAHAVTGSRPASDFLAAMGERGDRVFKFRLSGQATLRLHASSSRERYIRRALRSVG